MNNSKRDRETKQSNKKEQNILLIDRGRVQGKHFEIDKPFHPAQTHPVYTRTNPGKKLCKTWQFNLNSSFVNVNLYVSKKFLKEIFFIL